MQTLLKYCGLAMQTLTLVSLVIDIIFKLMK